MNKAGHYHRSDSWKRDTTSSGETSRLSNEAYGLGEDRITWPPVIARIRDLDKPVAPSTPTVAPSHQVAVASPAKTTTPSVRSRKSRWSRVKRVIKHRFSSRLIAVGGLGIFVVSMILIIHSRDNTSKTAGTWPQSPAPQAPPAPLWNGNTAASETPKLPSPASNVFDMPAMTGTAPNLTTPSTANLSGAIPIQTSSDKKEPADSSLSAPETGLPKASSSGWKERTADQRASISNDSDFAKNSEALRTQFSSKEGTDRYINQGESSQWSPRSAPQGESFQGENKIPGIADRRALDYRTNIPRTNSAGTSPNSIPPSGPLAPTYDRGSIPNMPGQPTNHFQENLPPTSPNVPMNSPVPNYPTAPTYPPTTPNNPSVPLNSPTPYPSQGNPYPSQGNPYPSQGAVVPQVPTASPAPSETPYLGSTGASSPEGYRIPVTR